MESKQIREPKRGRYVDGGGLREWRGCGCVVVWWAYIGKQLRGDGRSAALMVLYRFVSVELYRGKEALWRRVGLAKG